jgi:hypothetical protein
MILDSEAFAHVRRVLADSGYPTEHFAYAGAENVRDGNRIVPVVWFACRDRRFSPRRGQRVAFTEAFTIAFVKPLVMTVSVRDRLFRVVCTKGGRTVSTPR